MPTYKKITWLVPNVHCLCLITDGVESDVPKKKDILAGCGAVV